MPQFMKMTLSTFLVPYLATSLSGAAFSTSTVFLSSSKMGLSAIFIRMIQAPMVTKMLAQKIARHPQVCTASGGSSCTSTQARAPSTVPRAAPIITKDASRPRRPICAVSVSRVAPPACSAPAPKPCRNRSATSSSGAQMPMES